LKAMDDDPNWVKKIDELMEAVDSYIPIPQRAVDKPFLMPIEDIFSISGRGTVVTGRIERGIVKVGEEMEIVGFRPTFKTDVTGSAELPEGVEMVMPGDNVALAIELITPVALEKGLRFAIREGGRTVGAGTVTDIIA